MLDGESYIENLLGKDLVIERDILQIQDLTLQYLSSIRRYLPYKFSILLSRFSIA